MAISICEFVSRTNALARLSAMSIGLELAFKAINIATGERDLLAASTSTASPSAHITAASVQGHVCLIDAYGIR